jgi:nucleotide-binding universal stress UspA family protein
MKVLIGYDGSKDAVSLLKEAGRMGFPAGTEIQLLSVTSPWMPLAGAAPLPDRISRQAARIADDALKAATTLVEKGAAQLITAHPTWKISAAARIGNPAETLDAAARDGKFDLLVVGSHGRTALGRLLLGSVSHKLLHHPGSGLRIHRRRKGAGKGALRILVAVDGSRSADAAVDAVASRSWPKGTLIRVVTALEGRPLDAALRVLQGRGKGQEGWVELRTKAAARTLEATGCKVSRAVKVGDPRLSLLREASEWNADCIFLGTRGLGRWEGMLLGSVSSAVASHAPCSVELVHAKTRKSGGRK